MATRPDTHPLSTRSLATGAAALGVAVVLAAIVAGAGTILRMPAVLAVLLLAAGVGLGRDEPVGLRREW